MAKNNVNNVGTGKPRVGGAIFRAPLGIKVPTDPAVELDPSIFECMGYCNEDGLTEAEERETEELKAWGGDILQKPQSSFSKQYTFIPIETNKEVLKARFGSKHVDEDEAIMHVAHTSDELEHCVWVFDLLLNDHMISRKIVENGQVTEMGEIVYNGQDPVGYEMTMSVYPNGNNTYVDEYILDELKIKPSVSVEVSVSKKES